MKKNILSSVLCFGLLFNSIGVGIAKAEEEVETENNITEEINTDISILGEYAVAIDGITGEILYQKNANTKANPASITKVMTAILLEENVEDGEMISVSENARIQECSCFVFEENEKIAKEEIMKAMMIVSGNDAAMAIAEHVSGSQEKFGELMTKKAKSLGAKNTTFVTPSGLTAEEHKTTAYDMALILKEALKYPNVVNAMNLSSANIKTESRTKEVYRSSSRVEDSRVIGSKTGYTDAAGHTYVEMYEEDEKIVLVAVMKSGKEEKFTDAKTIANYALEKIESKEIIEENEKIKTIKISEQDVNLIAEESFTLTYNKDFEKEIKTEIEIEDDLKSVKKEQVIGLYKIYYKNDLIKEINLLSDKEIIVEEKKDYNFKYLFLIIVIPLILYIMYIFTYNNKKRKKHKK